MAHDWLADRAHQLRSAVGRRRVILPVEEAQELIAARVEIIGQQMGVSTSVARSYLTSEVIETMATSITSANQNLTPTAVGAGPLFERPRTCTISIRLAGRMIAGLAEAIKAHTLHGGTSLQVDDAAELLSNIGLVISDQDNPAGDHAAVFAMPPDLLILIANELAAAADAASDVPGTDELVRTLRQDATRVRACIIPVDADIP